MLNKKKGSNIIKTQQIKNFSPKTKKKVGGGSQ